jgi:hypothetical protein
MDYSIVSKAFELDSMQLASEGNRAEQDAVVAAAADALSAKHSEQVVVFDGLSGYYEVTSNYPFPAVMICDGSRMHYYQEHTRRCTL